MIYAITPSALREKGYVHDVAYQTAQLTSLLHRINQWLDAHRDYFCLTAEGLSIVNHPLLVRQDFQEFSDAEMEEALTWYRKMGWEIVKSDPDPSTIAYYKFIEPQKS